MEHNIVNEWQHKLEQQLDLRKGKKQLELSNRRVGVDKDAYHLIIGLGGTGCRALIETKGYIQLTCKDSEKNVAYLAFDTCKGDLTTYKSSAETGEVTLDSHTEQKFLDPDGVAIMLAPAFIATTMSTHPEIFEWIDTNLVVPGDGKGANHVRQAGRLLLWNNMQTIHDAIHDTIISLVSGSGDVIEFTVYLLTGISGGTGSGTFLDMAYLIRSIMQEIGGKVATSKLYGYFFMPDINNSYQSTDRDEKTTNNRNAYAALQELDYNLGLYSIGERFDILYPNNKRITAGIEPQGLFDMVHIVSALARNGTPLDNASHRANRAIAQNILSFVSNATITFDEATGQRINGFYGNVLTAAAAAIAQNNHAHRHGGYCAIGSASYELPIDDVMMYITNLLFKKLNTLFDDKRTPNSNECTNYKNRLSFTQSGVYTSAVYNVRQLMVPEDCSMKYLKSARPGKDYYWINEGAVVLNSRELWLQPVITNCHQMVENFKTAFDDLMAELFKDPAKGPVYAQRYIAKSGVLLTQIAAERESILKYIGKNPMDYPVGKDDALNVKKAALDALANFQKLSGKTKENADKCNSTGIGFFKECVWFSVAKIIDKYYFKEIIEYVEERNKNLYNFMVNVLDQLCETFDKNGDLLTDDAPQQKTLFTWQPLTIGMLAPHLNRMFDDTWSNDTNNLIGRFVEHLWDTAQIWMADPSRFDPRRFVSEYVDTEFPNIAGESIEDIVTVLLQQDGAAAQTLNASIVNDLMPSLIAAAQPMYHGRPDVPVGSQYTLVSVPESCPAIYTAVSGYCNAAAGLNATVQKSTIRNRIFVQTVLCGIQLTGYQTIKNAEDSYAQQYASQPGVHLYHPTSDKAQEKRDWNDLYTLIPRVYRPDAIALPAPTQALVEREDAQKKRFADQFDANNGYTCKLPLADMNTTNAQLWKVQFKLADVKVVYKDRVLRFLIGAAESVDLEMSLNETDPNVLMGYVNQLETLLSKGLCARYAPRNFIDLNTEVVLDPVRGIADGAKTFVNLQENYLRRYELMHAFEIEVQKYNDIRKFIEEAGARINALNAAKKKMLAFVQAMATGRISALPDFSNHMQAQFVGDKIDPNTNKRKVLNFDLGTWERDYEPTWKLGMFYCNALDAKDRLGDMVRKYRDITEKNIADISKEQNNDMLRKWIDRTSILLSEADNTLDMFAHTLALSADEQSAETFYKAWKAELDRFLNNCQQILANWENSSQIGYTQASSSSYDSDAYDI